MFLVVFYFVFKYFIGFEERIFFVMKKNFAEDFMRPD